MARTSSHSNLFTPTFKVRQHVLHASASFLCPALLQLSRRAAEHELQCQQCPPPLPVCLQAVLAQALERGVHGKEICSFIEEQQLDE